MFSDERYVNGRWQISACDDDGDPVASLVVPFESPESEDNKALSQLLYDELGDQDALYSCGQMFEVVAVPDDVAEALPSADGLVVLVGELLSLPEDDE